MIRDQELEYTEWEYKRRCKLSSIRWTSCAINMLPKKNVKNHIFLTTLTYNKTKTISKTDTLLKSKSDCRNNIRKSELTFTFCSVLFYMSKITFRIIFVWERMYKNKKSKKFIFNLKHMEENTNYLFSAIKLDAKKSFKHPWEAH